MDALINDRGKYLTATNQIRRELYNQWGQLDSKRTQSIGRMGLTSFSFPVGDDAPRGVWMLKTLVGSTQFQRTVRIETIKPNRLKISYDIKDKVSSKSKPFAANLHVEWLQGAVARNLKYDIETTFDGVATSFASYPDYTFDDLTRSELLSVDGPVISGVVDDNGDREIVANFNLKGSSTPRGMLRATFVTKVYEESGDFSIDAFTMPLSPYDQYIGLRSPQTDMHQLNTGEDHKFDIVYLTSTGTPLQ